MSRKPVRQFNCIDLTPPRQRALEELARHPNGAAAASPVLEGALLATLVAMGLAMRLPSRDRAGGRLYRCTDQGFAEGGLAFVPVVVDASAARTGGRS